VAAVLTPQDALVVVDVQNDFMPGGSLPVPDGDAVLGPVNAWVAAAEAAGAMIVLSRDWHPPDHSSFRENGGVWPPHCVQCTPGADFHPDLLMPGEFLEVSKGDLPDLDQYSDFEATCLGEALKRRGVRRVFVCGLAQDVCVKATALDALRLGFETRVIASATRPLSHESGERAFDDLRRAGAVIEEGPCQNP